MKTEPIGKSGDDAVHVRMRALGIDESDLVEKFIKGSGPGGQKINKTSSCVYLKHEPTGIEVKCQRERSQALNRLVAREELCDRIERRRLEQKRARQAEAARKRRSRRKRSAAAKARLLADKRMHSVKKGLRKPVRGDE